MSSSNTFGTQTTLTVSGKSYTIFRLPTLAQKFPTIEKLPYSMKILLENLLRTEDGSVVRAEDIEREGDAWRVTTGPTDLHAVRTAIEEAGHKVTSGDLVMIAQNHVPLEDVGSAKKTLDLVDALDDLDDVQAVFGNFDIPDDILEQLA